MIILPNPAASSVLYTFFLVFLSCLVTLRELIRSHLLVLPRACTRILVPFFLLSAHDFPSRGKTGINPSLRFISFSLLPEFPSTIQRFGNAKINSMPNPKFCREKRMRF